MRIILLSFLLMFIAENVRSQIPKGSLLLGGDFSLNVIIQKQSNAASRISYFNISPLLAKAVKDNSFWGGGFTIGFTNNQRETPTGATSNILNVGVNAFHRRYKNISEKFLVFLQGALNITYRETKYDNGPDHYYNQDNYFVSFSVNPGISFSVSKRLFLESGLNNIVMAGYTFEKSNGYNFGAVIDSWINSFSISSSLNNFNTNLYFGFRLILNKKSKV